MLKIISRNLKCFTVFNTVLATSAICRKFPWTINNLFYSNRKILELSVMPPKRGRSAKANSKKAKDSEASLVSTTPKKTKRNNDNEKEEPAAKKLKVEEPKTKDAEASLVSTTPKKTKQNEKKEEPAAKKSKDEEPKAMMNKVDTDLSALDFGCEKLNANGDKYNVKITTWNVSGIRAVIKKNGMDYILKEDADIVALQETKCATSKLPVEIKLPGYQRYFLESSSKPGYCGVAVYSKEKPIDIKYGLPNSNCNDEGRCITAEFEKFYLVNVYVPNAGAKLVTMPKRLKWNEAFKTHVLKLDKQKPVIICGDLNVAHQEIDLKNPKTNTKNAGFTPEEREGMTDLLAAGFVDTFRDLYPDKIDAYTFWAYFQNARAKNVGWRLDYYIVSERIKKNVCDQVIRDQVYGSDHCPVVLYMNL